MTTVTGDPTPPARPKGFRGVVALISLLLVRGILLWVVVPVALIFWLALWPVLRFHRVRLGQFLGWIDLNLVALIERTILRPMVPAPFPWTPARALPNITHRIGPFDPV
jgi:hypothetical protein